MTGIPGGPPWYHLPTDRAGTVFDPHNDTFGPIMSAIQHGDFERASKLLDALAKQASHE